MGDIQPHGFVVADCIIERFKYLPKSRIAGLLGYGDPVWLGCLRRTRKEGGFIFTFRSGSQAYRECYRIACGTLIDNPGMDCPPAEGGFHRKIITVVNARLVGVGSQKTDQMVPHFNLWVMGSINGSADDCYCQCMKGVLRQSTKDFCQFPTYRMVALCREQLDHFFQVVDRIARHLVTGIPYCGNAMLAVVKS